VGFGGVIKGLRCPSGMAGGGGHGVASSGVIVKMRWGRPGDVPGVWGILMMWPVMEVMEWPIGCSDVVVKVRSIGAQVFGASGVASALSKARTWSAETETSEEE